MVCRGHAKEIVGLLNVNCIYLNILFDGRSRYIELTFNNPTVSLV
jgi:hypothetical protein